MPSRARGQSASTTNDDIATPLLMLRYGPLRAVLQSYPYSFGCHEKRGREEVGLGSLCRVPEGIGIAVGRRPLSLWIQDLSSPRAQSCPFSLGGGAEYKKQKGIDT